MVRLDKYIAQAANLTRKEAKEALSKGRIRINGEICKKGDCKIDESDEVTLDNRPLAAERFLYFMLHKPAGVVSATEDARDKTVIDLVREQEGETFTIGKQELFPVGRLDKDTEGLLLLTNDGELAHRLLSPKRHIDKVYFAKLNGTVPEDAVERFAEGIWVGKEYKALPAKLEVIAVEQNCSEVKVTLQEGKFHQVKRMCHEIGCEVTYLKRISMGSLQLDETLPCGACRKLTKEEVEALKDF